MNNSTIINQNMLDFSTERKLFILFAILFVSALIYQRRKILLLETESFISSEKEILDDLIIDQNAKSPTTPKFGLKMLKKQGDLRYCFVLLTVTQL